MAIDEGLNEIFRNALVGTPAVTEKKMMGGVCFLVNGNMLGGAHRGKDGAGYFMFRVGKENTPIAKKIGRGEIVELGGRIMGGFYYVGADDCSDALFEEWKSLALSYALSLPPK